MPVKSQNKSIHEDVRYLPDEDPLSFVKVKKWIEDSNIWLHENRKDKVSTVSKERVKYRRIETYVWNLKKYLSTGVYLDLYYGPDMENTITNKVVAMSYDSDGTPKRTIGYYYPDIGYYTKEMAEDNE